MDRGNIMHKMYISCKRILYFSVNYFDNFNIKSRKNLKYG
jgi:hypothetical protein